MPGRFDHEPRATVVGASSCRAPSRACGRQPNSPARATTRRASELPVLKANGTEHAITRSRQESALLACATWTFPQLLPAKVGTPLGERPTLSPYQAGASGVDRKSVV